LDIKSGIDIIDSHLRNAFSKRLNLARGCVVLPA